MKVTIILLLMVLKPIGYELIQKGNGKLKTGWYYIVDKENSYSRQLYKSNNKYFIDPEPIVSIKHFNKIELITDDFNGKPNQYLSIRFDAVGADAWSKATGKSIYKKLALIIDDKLIYAPEVNAQITGGISALNPGNYSKAELENFEKIIKSEM
ncbi:MAG: SecDF P1 head subdomain-containing protein [Mucilaginibacter sp.]